MKILLIDNYDSYTYNLKQYLENHLGTIVSIVKNDKVEKEDIDNSDALVLSPGPGLPHTAGKLMETLDYASLTHPILGVCLGHQAIGLHFGGSLFNLESPLHGIQSEIEIIDRDNPIFQNTGPSLKVGRYHSWVLDRKDFPNSLRISSVDKENQIMALRHHYLPVYGVQFHPESILTPMGQSLINNFVSLVNSVRTNAVQAE
jgi:anthranilate synthase component 2